MSFTLPDGTRIGRVTLRVRDPDEQRAFYESVVGLTGRRADDRTVELSAPNGEPLVVLREAPDGRPRPDGAAGLYHLAIRVPDRAALAAALDRIRSSDAPFAGASDHHVSEALYLSDPAGNGVEIYRDRPRESWSRTADGGIRITTEPLDLEALAAEAPPDPPATVPDGTDVGHVHLEVTDLSAAERFYVDGLGLSVTATYGEDALFVAAGGYHHHVGLNTWRGRTEPTDEDVLGLAHFELVVPDGAARDRLRGHLDDRGIDYRTTDGRIELVDVDGIGVHVRTER